MRFLAFLFIAGVILSLARALTLVLILALAILIIWALLTSPLEVFGFALFSLLGGALQARPTATILCVAAVVVVATLRKAKAAADDSA